MSKEWWDPVLTAVAEPAPEEVDVDQCAVTGQRHNKSQTVCIECYGHLDCPHQYPDCTCEECGDTHPDYRECHRCSFEPECEHQWRCRDCRDPLTVP